MSTLFVNTIRPDSGSNVLISSSLTVSESLKVAGDFELSGSIKLGNADTDSIGFVADVSSSILPDANETFDLGSTSKKWRHLHAVGVTASGDISSSGTIIAQNIQIDSFNISEEVFTSITASGDISTSGAFIGDGSQLSGVGISGSALDVVSINVDTFVSGAGTGSFNHFFVSGEISGSVSASGTGSFQGGIDAIEATGSFGYISASGDITAAGTIFALAITSSGNISGSNIIANGDISSSGTGSFNHLAVSGEISGAVSASGTGSFAGGIDAIEATGSFGYISSSGDISSSGTGSFEHIVITSQIIGNVSASGTASFQGGVDCIGDGTGMSPASGAFGYISTSGDINVNDILTLSASGDITTVHTASFGHVIINAGSTNHSISASGDIRLNTGSFFVGDGRLLTNITTSVSPPGADTQVVFNDGGSLGADAGFVYNKTTNNLSVSGSITIGAGPPASNFEGHVSASGTGSFGGGVDAVGTTGSFGYISCSGDISSSGLGFFANGIETDVTATGSFGYISCSGNISISGHINAANGRFNTTVSASLLKGQQVQAQVGNNLGYRFNLNDDSKVNGIQYNTIGERAHLQIPSLPTSVTNPFTASSTARVGGDLTAAGAVTIAGTTTTAGALNVDGNFNIAGVAVTATAAELNKMDGFGGTTDQLNSLIKSAAAEIEGGKSVEYDSDGAVKLRSPKSNSTATLTVGDSGTTILATGGTPQTFTLPGPEGASGVFFNFVATSAQQHVIRLGTGVNQINGFIIDFTNGAASSTNDTTVATTRLSNQGKITLNNPTIGDNLQFICDGERWYVRGMLNDTPTTGTV